MVRHLLAETIVKHMAVIDYRRKQRAVLQEDQIEKSNNSHAWTFWWEWFVSILVLEQCCHVVTPRSLRSTSSLIFVLLHYICSAICILHRWFILSFSNVMTCCVEGRWRERKEARTGRERRIKCNIWTMSWSDTQKKDIVTERRSMRYELEW